MTYFIVKQIACPTPATFNRTVTGSRKAHWPSGPFRTSWSCPTRRGGSSLMRRRWGTTVRRSDGILPDGHFCGPTSMPRCFMFMASLEPRPSMFSTPSGSCASTRSETTASTERDALSSKPTTAWPPPPLVVDPAGRPLPGCRLGGVPGIHTTAAKPRPNGFASEPACPRCWTYSRSTPFATMTAQVRRLPRPSRSRISWCDWSVLRQPSSHRACR